jgi:uncharacterized protein
MSMEISISQQNPHRRWQFTLPDTIIAREKYFSFMQKEIEKKYVTILTWLRRIGKTTLMKQTINYLIQEKKINPMHILYCSCDFSGFNQETELTALVNNFRKDMNILESTKIYVFVDEITYLNDCNRQMKNIFDMSELENGNIKLFATSSSASILNDKKALLTWRHRTMEVQPLDFFEFLQFKKYETNPMKISPSLLWSYFESYLQIWGIPEYVLSWDPVVISNIINDIIKKDIIVAYEVREHQKIQELFKLLLERVGKQISINKIANILDISKQTAQKRVDYFLSTYLFFSLWRYGKVNDTIRNAKKIYIADTGIISVFRDFKDLWSIYENSIYSLIKHLNPQYYYNSGNEIDFIIWQKNNQLLLETKYWQELSPGQKKLFENFEGNKHIIDSFDWYFYIWKNFLKYK